ncbi:MAG: hypothetical protein IAE67_08930 [Candidatus Competibacteraceae bacterium]|nr:hypothetical protein [Candidatus Competibacteraceae bacterium]
MKKTVFILCLASIVMSCGGITKRAADIKVSEIKSACDCINSIDIVLNETLSIIDKFKTEEAIEADADAKKQMQILESKFTEIDNHCGQTLGIKSEDSEKCENFKSIKEKLEKIEAVL